MDKIYEEVAHDSEILTLSYSKEVDGNVATHCHMSVRDKRKVNEKISLPIFAGLQFLATGSRDRMMHIFALRDGGAEYEPILSIPDHSGSVTAVRFTAQGDSVQLLSSGTDKSVIFHSVEREEVRD